MTVAEARHESKTRLLDAALHVFRAKGYSATRIEDICAEAGLTKGSFFHHFSGKEALAVAAAEHWSAVTGAVFASAPYRSLPDPLDRLLGYVDFRRAILRGELPQFTCLAGTMVQEVYGTHPAVRDACCGSIADHAAVLEADIAEAIDKYGIDTYGSGAAWSARSLALYTQAVIQGAFVLAKAQQSSAVAADCIDHLRRYVEMLFRPLNSKEKDHANHHPAGAGNAG